MSLAGCSGTKPCLVIPAQLELARDTRDSAKETLDDKIKELDRWQNAVVQSRARIDRLTEDRDELKTELEHLEMDGEDTGGEKK